MKRKPQYRWAIVHRHGHINHGYMCFTRKNVIEEVVKEYRGFTNHPHAARYAAMTDAQLWRFIKHERGFRACRIQLKVA